MIPTRGSPRRARVLRGHWRLPSGLRRALRTERRVRLAVLYALQARGDVDAGSDLDLLVSLAVGRVLVSRDGQLRQPRERRRAIGARAQRAHPRQAAVLPARSRG